MNNRFVWNFEINNDKPLVIPSAGSIEQDQKRWESRYFWPDEQIITLHGLPDSFLKLSQYNIKDRKDIYFLLPNTDYNLKIRHEKLFYKPILMKYPHAIAYDKKIKLEEQALGVKLPGCEEKDAQTLIARIRAEGVQVSVEKEALIYQFDTTPITKIELARLYIANKTYFTASIESKALLLVDSIARQLLGHLPASDYVTFLKEILSQ